MNWLLLRTWGLRAAGILFLALGIVGIVLPLLPTTPFLLLAAACFVRSSERLYRWLIEHRWLGTYIRNYREHRAITLATKIVSLTMLWGVMSYTAFFVIQVWWLRAVLGAIAVGVTIHLLSLKTLRKDTHAKKE